MRDIGVPRDVVWRCSFRGRALSQAARLSERLQNVGPSRRQPGRCSGNRSRVGRWERDRQSGGAWRQRAGEASPDGASEFLWRHRLTQHARHVEVIDLLGRCRHDHDGNVPQMRLGGDFLRHGVPAQDGHHKVQQNEIRGRVPIESPQSLQPVCRLRYLKSGQHQGSAIHPPHRSSSSSTTSRVCRATWAAYPVRDGTKARQLSSARLLDLRLQKSQLTQRVRRRR